MERRDFFGRLFGATIGALGVAQVGGLTGSPAAEKPRPLAGATLGSAGAEDWRVLDCNNIAETLRPHMPVIAREMAKEMALQSSGFGSNARRAVFLP